MITSSPERGQASYLEEALYLPLTLLSAALLVGFVAVRAAPRLKRKAEELVTAVRGWPIWFDLYIHISWTCLCMERDRWSDELKASRQLIRKEYSLHGYAALFSTQDILGFPGPRFLGFHAPDPAHLAQFKGRHPFVKALEGASKLVRLISVEEAKRRGFYYWSDSQWQKRLNLEVQEMDVADWPDMDVIPVERLLELVNAVLESEPNELIGLHCIAGRGRTGTLIAACLMALSAREQLRIGVKPERVEVDIEKIVRALNWRHPVMVSTQSQYALLYKLFPLLAGVN